MIPRSTLLDNSVSQGERLDFAAGAICTPPLEQRRPAPQVFNSNAPALDTLKTLPSLNRVEESKFEKTVSEAKKKAWPETEKIREQWVDDRIAEGMQNIGDEKPEEKERELRETYEQALKRKVLLTEFPIHLTKDKTVTVGEILANKDQYHATKCLDPLEPDYHNFAQVAWVNTRTSGKPYIRSFAQDYRVALTCRTEQPHLRF